jgi:hypothetical protein
MLSNLLDVAVFYAFSCEGTEVDKMRSLLAERLMDATEALGV